MKIAHSVILLACLSVLRAEENQPKVFDPAKVAEKLLFPKESLICKDITEQTRLQLGPGVIHAEELVGKDDNTFHPILFVVAQPSTLMTNEFIRRTDASIAATRDSPNFKRFELADGSWGYIGMEVMGPHGALIASTFTDSKKQRDIKIAIACGFGELTLVQGGEAYGKQFSGEIDATPALLEVVQDVIKKAQSFSMPTSAKERNAAPSQLNPTSPPTSTATAAERSLSPTTASQQVSFLLPFGLLLLAIASLVIAGMLRWKRK